MPNIYFTYAAIVEILKSFGGPMPQYFFNCWAEKFKLAFLKFSDLSLSEMPPCQKCHKCLTWKKIEIIL